MNTRAGYWIGGGLIVAAVVGAILWGVLSFVAIGDTLDDFVRVPAPGSQEVQLEQRKYIVYFEGPGAGEDHVPPIEVGIRDARNEQPLGLAGYSGSLTYSIGGHSGTAQATVTPPRAGRYVVSAATTQEPSAGLEVALGESIGGKILRAILGAFAVGGVFLVAGIILIVMTATRRRRTPPPPTPQAPAPIAGLEG